VFFYAQRLRDLSHLKHRPNAGAYLGIDRVSAKHGHRAHRRFRQPKEQLDRSGLTGAVRSEQRHQFAGADSKIHPAQSLHLSEILAGVTQLRNHRSSIARFSLRTCLSSL
jgi:hypothetical protein